MEELLTPNKIAGEPIDLADEPSYALVLAAGKRPAEDLYDLRKDPGQ